MEREGETKNMELKNKSIEQEEHAKFMNFEFESLASDVIDYVTKERNQWRRLAFILAVGVVIEAAILAAVILM